MRYVDYALAWEKGFVFGMLWGFTVSWLAWAIFA